LLNAAARSHDDWDMDRVPGKPSFAPRALHLRALGSNQNYYTRI
jgi:hypothetical protein